MTAKQLFERAMLLLGYVDANGDVLVDTGLQKRAVAMMNQIAADLALAADPNAAPEPIVRLSEDVPLLGRAALDAAPYGVAMLLAGAQGDIDAKATFATVYNRKRAVCGGVSARQNVLP